MHATDIYDRSPVHPIIQGSENVVGHHTAMVVCPSPNYRVERLNDRICWSPTMLHPNSFELFPDARYRFLAWPGEQFIARLSVGDFVLSEVPSQEVEAFR